MGRTADERDARRAKLNEKLAFFASHGLHTDNSWHDMMDEYISGGNIDDDPGVVFNDRYTDARVGSRWVQLEARVDKDDDRKIYVYLREFYAEEERDNGILAKEMFDADVQEIASRFTPDYTIVFETMENEFNITRTGLDGAAIDSYKYKPIPARRPAAKKRPAPTKEALDARIAKNKAEAAKLFQYSSVPEYYHKWAAKDRYIRQMELMRKRLYG